MPNNTDDMPSVIMNGGMRSQVVPSPLATPTTTPMAKPTPAPAAIAMPGASGMAVNTIAITVALVTEVSATIVPTDRSRPPQISTISWPSATISR